MDDANIPSLLALPYLESVAAHDPVYLEYPGISCGVKPIPIFLKGKPGEGIGGPHIGYDMVWPMSLIMKAMDEYGRRRNPEMCEDAEGY